MSRRVEDKRQPTSRSVGAGPIMLVVGLLLGLLLGYGLSFLLGGSGYATPSDMSPTAQAFWVRMTADSLAVTGNAGQADVFMDLFPPEEQNRLLGQEIAAAQGEGDVARVERLSQLGQALQLSPTLPGDPAATPGTTPAAPDNNALAQLLMACGGALLLLLLLVGGGIILTRSRQGSAPPPRDRGAIRSRRRDATDDDLPALPSPDETAAEVEELEDIDYEPMVQEAAPPALAPAAPATPAARSASWHVQDNASVTASRPSVDALPALDSFQARYSYGDDDFDVQFSIEDANTEFLGECGVGAAELLDSSSPNKVTAVELWLFDKADVRTVSKILLSEHAWHDPAIKSALAARGDLVPIREGAVIDVETKTLRVRAHVRELEYGSGGTSRNSFFERLAIDLTPQVKQ